MWKKYSLPTLYLAVVFLCGTAVGVFGYRAYEVRSVAASAPGPRSPEEWKKRHLQEMTTRLQLTADQQARISQVLDETHTQMRELMEKSKPVMDRIQHDQYARVKAVLTPEQAAEYDKYHAEREMRRGSPPR